MQIRPPVVGDTPGPAVRLQCPHQALVAPAIASPSPSVHSGRIQFIQVHRCVLALSLPERLGCDLLDYIGSGVQVTPLLGALLLAPFGPPGSGYM